jgi:hypothetical protein
MFTSNKRGGDVSIKEKREKEKESRKKKRKNKIIETFKG